MNEIVPGKLEQNTAKIKTQTYNKRLRRISSVVDDGVLQSTYTGCAGKANKPQKEVADLLTYLYSYTTLLYLLGDLIYADGVKSTTSNNQGKIDKAKQAAIEKVKKYILDIYTLIKNDVSDKPLYPKTRVIIGNHGNNCHLNKFSVWVGVQVKLQPFAAILDKLGLCVADLGKCARQRSALVTAINEAQGIGSSNYDSPGLDKITQKTGKSSIDKEEPITEAFFFRSPYYYEVINDKNNKTKSIVIHIDSSLLPTDEQQKQWLTDVFKVIHENYSDVKHKSIMTHHAADVTACSRAGAMEERKYGDKVSLQNHYQRLSETILECAKKVDGFKFKKTDYVLYAAHEHTWSLYANDFLTEALRDVSWKTIVIASNGGAKSNKKDFNYVATGNILTHTGYGATVSTQYDNGNYTIHYFEADKNNKKVIGAKALFWVKYNEHGRVIDQSSWKADDIIPYFDRKLIKISTKLFKKHKPLVEMLATAINTKNLDLIQLHLFGSFYYAKDLANKVLTQEQMDEFFDAVPPKMQYTHKDLTNYIANIEGLLVNYFFRYDAQGKIVGPAYPNSHFYSQLNMVRDILYEVQRHKQWDSASQVSEASTSDKPIRKPLPKAITYDFLLKEFSEDSVKHVEQSNAFEDVSKLVQETEKKSTLQDRETKVKATQALPKSTLEATRKKIELSKPTDINAFLQAVVEARYNRLRAESFKRYKNGISSLFDDIYQPNNDPYFANTLLFFRMLNTTLPEDLPYLVAAAVANNPLLAKDVGDNVRYNAKISYKHEQDAVLLLDKVDEESDGDIIVSRESADKAQVLLNQIQGALKTKGHENITKNHQKTKTYLEIFSHAEHLFRYHPFVRQAHEAIKIKIKIKTKEGVVIGLGLVNGAITSIEKQLKNRKNRQDKQNILSVLRAIKENKKVSSELLEKVDTPSARQALADVTKYLLTKDSEGKSALLSRGIFSRVKGVNIPRESNLTTPLLFATTTA